MCNLNSDRDDHRARVVPYIYELESSDSGSSQSESDNQERLLNTNW